MQKITDQQKAERAKKAEQVAKGLYPYEKWQLLEEGIYIAKSRQPISARQLAVLENELRQARILTERGYTVYLLPENAPPTERRVKYPDAVVDGNIMEFKTITGGIRQVERRYKEAREKAKHIFLKIDADITRHDVSRKLSGYIKRKGFSGGFILVHFSQSSEFYKWSEAELAAESNLTNG